MCLAYCAKDGLVGITQPRMREMGLRQVLSAEFASLHAKHFEWLSGDVANAGSTKREPTVVGKPAEFMLANIAETFGLKRDQICMVGDRLDTDILFGQHGGLTTMLVLSGETPPT